MPTASHVLGSRKARRPALCPLIASMYCIKLEQHTLMQHHGLLLLHGLNLYFFEIPSLACCLKVCRLLGTDQGRVTKPSKVHNLSASIDLLELDRHITTWPHNIYFFLFDRTAVASAKTCRTYSSDSPSAGVNPGLKPRSLSRPIPRAEVSLFVDSI